MPPLLDTRSRQLRTALRLTLLCCAGLTACGPIATAGPGCQPIQPAVALAPELDEASGVAVSLAHPDVFWTHGDGPGELFAVNAEGTELGRYAFRQQIRDWEDLALAPCPDGGSCLYLADLGDNYEERQDARIIRIPEPDPHGRDTLTGEVFPLAYPDGPRDAEAMLVLPGERILIVTKGRNHPVTVYGYPGRLRPDRVVLEQVQTLTENPPILPRQVTGASVSPRGSVLAIRTYQALRFYSMEGDTLALREDGIVNLRTLREAQGEGVGLGLDGLVALTTEGGPGGGPGGLTLLRCNLALR